VFFGCSAKDNTILEKPLHVEPIKIDENLTKEEIKEELTVKVKQDIPIYDLVNIPQNIEFYSKNIDKNSSIYDIQKKYEKYYFSMWNKQKPVEDLKSVKWPFVSYTFGKSYGENFQLLKQEFFDNMMKKSNFKNYATLNLKALTLRETNIRAFPTNKPLLKDPSLAGEGFPFDYLQNSIVHANKPILVSHYSKDGAWAYIFTSFTSGWIKISEFVVIDKKYTDIWQKAKQVSIVKEDIAIYSENKNFMFKSKIGMMFALISENDKTYTILTVSSSSNNKAVFKKSKISKEIASRSVLRLNEANINTIVKEVSKTNYGWGGVYGQRDCSSMLRDFYSPFGIWLPRNSYQQSLVGKVLSLKGLDNNEKIKLIKEKAIPFETLLYKKGHIVLYVGTYNDEIVIFHNTWGIKTLKDGVEGRKVIGRTIFSSLNLGEHQKNYDEDSGILKNLKSMNILTR